MEFCILSDRSLVGKAPACGAGTRRFEPDRSFHLLELEELMSVFINHQVVAWFFGDRTRVHVSDSVLAYGVLSVMDMTTANDISSVFFSIFRGFDSEDIAYAEDLLAPQLDLAGQVSVLFAKGYLNAIIEATPETAP